MADQEICHIVDSQIIDVVEAEGISIKIFFMGGFSMLEMQQGGTNPGIFDVTVFFEDISYVALIASFLREWSLEDAPVTFIAYESGTARFTNQASRKTIEAIYNQ